MLGGCAVDAPFTTGGAVDVGSIELRDVPFFAQTEYQCGPAALATVLADRGAPVDGQMLVDAVYVAGLHGSLQSELLGATRRYGFIPYVLEPDPAELYAELAAGRPVLVLQNLGLPRAPVWHYAVVVGVDREADRVILRSGVERRRLERTSRFLTTWRRGDHWAFVAVEPGTLAATATPDRHVRALAGAEPLLSGAAARAAYDSALAKWPDHELVLFAAAARKHADRDLDAATTLYRRLLAIAPTHAAARNNFANVLAERGCRASALAEARAALAIVDSADPLYAPIGDTVASLERDRTEDGASCR